MLLQSTVSLLWWAAIVAPITYLCVRILASFAAYMRKCRLLMKLPGSPPTSLILGHFAEFPGTGEEGLKFMVDRCYETPKLAYMFMGPFPTIQVHHPETAKAIFRTAEPKPLDITGGYRFVLPWLGKGLLISKGSQWARNRRLLTPAFHFDILKPYMNVNNKAMDIMLGKMTEFAKSEEYFDVFKHVSLCTFDIILKCAFSYENDVQMKGENNPYVKAVNELTANAPYRLLRPWLYPDFICALTKEGRQFRKNCNYVHSLAEDIICSRKKTLQTTDVNLNKRYLDFLDILLTAKDADGKGLSDKEIRQEVDTFLFEGHDTTASGISWALYSLAKHPEHMQKCQQEVDEVLNGKGNDVIEWDDLPKLKYLNMCLKEAMRMHVPVNFIQRITTKDMYLDGYFIPKGSNISLNLFLMSHNPYVWEKHDQFIPERFASDKADKMDSYQFVPFSAGPRNCIGQSFAMHEMKVVVGRILRKFDLQLKPGHEVRRQTQAVMKTEDGHGIFMRAVPRKTSPQLVHG